MSAMLFKSRFRELARHVASVLLRYAEAQCPHLPRVEHDPLNRFEQFRYTDVVAREEVAQLLRRIATASPGQLTQIRAVGHPEVLEWDEEALIDRLPQAQLDGDPVVEPLGDVAPIQPFRCCGEAEQFTWLQAAQETVVAVGRSVMELVDHDHIECVRRDLLDPAREAIGSSRRRDAPPRRVRRRESRRNRPAGAPPDTSLATARRISSR